MYGRECAQGLELEHLLTNTRRCKKRQKTTRKFQPHSRYFQTSLRITCFRITPLFSSPPPSQPRQNSLFLALLTHTAYLLDISNMTPFINLSMRPVRYLDTLRMTWHVLWPSTFLLSSLLIRPLIFLPSSGSLLFSLRQLFWYPMNFLGFYPCQFSSVHTNYILLFFPRILVLLHLCISSCARASGELRLYQPM